VDGDTIVTDRDALATAQVAARVVGEAKGPKIKGFTYKPKTRGRRAWGHRQRYTTIEITGITREG
jgi:large subunit ribosomal protein L21